MPVPPVPKENDFITNMKLWAGYMSSFLSRTPRENYGWLGHIYYDIQACAYKLRSHLNSTTLYERLIQQGHDGYVNDYVLPNYGAIPGFRVFSEGSCLDVINKTRRERASLLSMLLILQNNNYHVSDPDISNPAFSRECAYALMTFINVERTQRIALSPAQQARRDLLLTSSLSIVQKWKDNQAEYFRPFMGALTARALIMYHTHIQKDPRILPAIKTIAALCQPLFKEQDGPWGQGKSFFYTDRVTGSDPEDSKTQPDLNLLICPLFGWLYFQTKETQYRDLGCKAFEGGVSVYDQYGHHSYGAFLGTRSSINPSGKQYCQQLFWGLDFLAWAK